MKPPDVMRQVCARSARPAALSSTGGAPSAGGGALNASKQIYLGPIGLMMQGATAATYLTKITADLTNAPSITGANRSALSTSVVYRAVIEGNTAQLASGATGVASVIAITSGYGIQPDDSFQQHGGILYNGNYGWGFLRYCLERARKAGRQAVESERDERLF